MTFFLQACRKVSFLVEWGTVLSPYKICQERCDAMKTQTTMAQDLDTWQEERKLDEACCRLVANKVILARLLQAVVQEYKDC